MGVIPRPTHPQADGLPSARQASQMRNDWSEHVAEGFPAPRDDEPRSLRQDIVDELSDHLGCALRRELHRTQDEQQARKNVLARFGDPRRIARQLWFEAMKEKIMSQRITLVMSCILAAAGVAVAVMGWKMAEQTRETNLAILDRLDALAAPAPPKSAPSLEWHRFQVRLVPEGDEEPSVDEFQVRLEGNVLSPGEGMALIEKTALPGTVDFGLVRTGSHQVTVRSPWGESHSREVTVRPGRENLEEFVCPAAPPEEVLLNISVNWPDDLQDRNLALLAECEVSSSPRTISGAAWSQPSSGAVLLIYSDGTAHRVSIPNVPNVNRLKPNDRHEVPLEAEARRWLGDRFVINNFAIVKLPPDGILPEADRITIEPVLRVSLSRPLDDAAITARGITFNFQFIGARRGLIQGGATMASGETFAFQATRGQLNEWEITLPEDILPEELWENLRKILPERTTDDGEPIFTPDTPAEPEP